MKPLALLIFLLAALWLWHPQDIPAVHGEWTDQVEHDMVAWKHRQHGIQGSVYDRETGKRYFYRDGRRCELWVDVGERVRL